MPPPPINWHSKPKPHQQRSQSNSSSSASNHSSVGTDGLVPVYINPTRLADIEAALQYLGLPPLSDPGSNHDQATPHWDNVSHPSLPQFKRPNNPASPQYMSPQTVSAFGRSISQDSLDYSDLSASFSRLSTSITSTSPVKVPSASFQVQPSPVVQPNSSPRKNLKRYYVVTVGKCTGVFWDEWDNILPLVSGVPGARYKGFPTREQAVAFYLDAKKNRLVSVVRDPGDDAIFGPSNDAM